jgi:hypothetical protein
VARIAPGFRPAVDCFCHRAGEWLVRACVPAGPDCAVFGSNDAAPRTRSPATDRTDLPGIYNTGWASVPHRALMRAAASPDFLGRWSASAKFGVQEIRGRPWRVRAGPSARAFSRLLPNRGKSIDAASLTRKLHKIRGRKIAPAVRMLQGLGAAMGTTGGAWRKGIHVLVQAAGKRD